MEMFDIAFYIFLLVMVFLSASLVMGFNLKPPAKPALKYASAIFLACVLFILPFFDIVKVYGFLAAIILEESYPSIYGTIIGILVANLTVYGFHIFFSSANLLKAERYKENVIMVGQYSLRRHPIYASYHIIGLGYQVVMGSITGVIITSLLMAVLYLETFNIEKKILLPHHGKQYREYMRIVSKKIYSYDILIIVSVMYLFFFVGIIDSMMNPPL